MNNNQNDRHERTIALIGEQALTRLQNSVVAVVGLGGVGGFAAEALARSGVGTLLLVDGDTIAPSNINRQIFATNNNIGMNKAMAARERLLAVNPDLHVRAMPEYIHGGNADALLTPTVNVLVDAIDSMQHKLDLIEYAHSHGIPIVSAAGAGNRLSPEGMRSADIFETSGDPMCRIMRRELRKRGISAHPVVYIPGKRDTMKIPPASMVFVPGCMGLMLAQQALGCLIEGGFQ